MAPAQRQRNAGNQALIADRLLITACRNQPLQWPSARPPPFPTTAAADKTLMPAAVSRNI